MYKLNDQFQFQFTFCFEPKAKLKSPYDERIINISKRFPWPGNEPGIFSFFIKFISLHS